MEPDHEAAEPKAYRLKAEAGHYKLTINPMAMIVDGPTRTEINDFVGATSCRWNGVGEIQIEVTAAPPRGTRNEPLVLKVLRMALASHGRPGATEEPGQDSRGEDGFLRFPDGSRLQLQVVSVPPYSEFGKALAQGDATWTISIQEAAEWINDAIAHKSARIPKAQRASITLVLDVRHVGLLCDSKVLEAFSALYPNPAEHGFSEIWIVGPIVARTARLA